MGEQMPTVEQVAHSLTEKLNNLVLHNLPVPKSDVLCRLISRPHRLTIPQMDIDVMSTLEQRTSTSHGSPHVKLTVRETMPSSASTRLTTFPTQTFGEGARGGGTIIYLRCMHCMQRIQSRSCMR